MMKHNFSETALFKLSTNCMIFLEQIQFVLGIDYSLLFLISTHLIFTIVHFRNIVMKVMSTHGILFLII